ncbi:TetR/AcrR family transcriptional regulator [Glycomyces sp. TRM65418]|uniref:TetR/AcrR family transcriptional regulator n=1 Tax=Glycomyces sp. TRM65418 TaxID=2867006 RepID=UPI001CE6D234|nr:TetR/AcrR family transcriptional regulator [Glycomyces sp. TRM65418]MCC3761849.1 TetR/AcrR family transcriptional regulator [Glycomyces sp. TRM65418]QZD55931.1 TetR/AcrR family transcriptional regulator [Glycomyces sp. TRM65418]
MNERETTRRRIVDAAATLLEEHGIDMVTTRAVSAAAGVQPPTIYRLFTDMSGLLEAVASQGFDDYLGRKHAVALTDDPVEDLRSGWDVHVQFGLENPALYLLMYGQRTPGRHAAAVERAAERLHLLVRRVAEAGRLKVAVETGAAMIHAAGSGLMLSLIATDPEDRDPDLSPRLREAMIASITGEARAEARDCAQRAAGLKAVLDEAPGLLSPGERALLGELLDRLADAPSGSGPET